MAGSRGLVEVRAHDLRVGAYQQVMRAIEALRQQAHLAELLGVEEEDLAELELLEVEERYSSRSYFFAVPFALETG
ncbi:MAG: hypothetical protein WBC13_13295 [Dokdonella sp.]|jgi:hypothetical protein|uniref:hypothetical protein n=1 Tax=Dokdonella sp. TaxID=2291710 RepID=UPI002DD66E3C|nr:hypothetical protein [Dokdonella sp.]MCC6439854.1 hypothetical protein [Rhodanobacteraceae bacterium]